MRTKLKILLGIGFALLCSTVQAQQTFLLTDLIQKAEQNYPDLKQKNLIENISSETDKLLNASLIPTLSIVGQGTYQSEVTKFGDAASGFPVIPKDNYNIGLDLRLPLTDFGVVSSKKKLELEKSNVSLKQLDVELQRLRERVTALYANILLQKENEKILFIRKKELESQQKKVAVAVNNGAVLKSSQLVFESEILLTEQKIIEVDEALLNSTQELSILTGLSVGPDADFQVSPEVLLQKEINRPELELFASLTNVIEIQKKVLRRENLPKLSVFGQGNYGRPGYNFLDVNLRTYGIAGLNLNWNINNFAIQSKRVKQYDLNQTIVESQKETFNMNLQISLNQKQNEINKCDSVLLKDEDIVRKRKEILITSASQLENGSITSTEYLTELNAANAAELNQVVHKVQKTIAQLQYNLLKGN